MNLLKFQWRIYFRPLCTHSTVTKQHFGVHHSIWTGKEMNDVSSFIVYGYKKRGSSFQKPTCLFPASRFCLTRFTLWNMHEAEPDTERSCSDVSFRPCNTSWPDICKKKRKERKSMWTHPQMAFVLEGNRASRRLSVRPLQLRFPCRLYWLETPVLLLFSNILGKEHKHFSSLRMSDESEATGLSSGQRKNREVGLHAGRVSSSDVMSDCKISYLFWY